VKLRRLTLPQVVERFARYYERPRNGAWGDLHIVLDDHNVDDDSIDWCEKHIRDWLYDPPLAQWDYEIAHDKMYGLMLCHFLRRLTKTQRLKLPHVVDRYLKRAQEPGRFRWQHRRADLKWPWRDGAVKLTCLTCRQGRTARYSAMYMLAGRLEPAKILARVAEHAAYALRHFGCPHVGDGRQLPSPDFLPLEPQA
jgi:hypothetical protein